MKKNFNFIIILIFVLLSLTACKRDTESKKNTSEGIRPPLLIYKDVLYQTTGEDESFSNEFTLVGEIQKKLNHNELPKEELHSNVLNKGTKVYTKKNINEAVYIYYTDNKLIRYIVSNNVTN